MRAKISLAIAAFALLAAAVPSWAHHAFAAEFDVNKPLQLKGTVTKMEWINPHAWIHIDVKDASGNTTEWMIEAGAPNGLLRRGFTKASLPAGTKSWWKAGRRRTAPTVPMEATSRCPTARSCSLDRPAPVRRSKRTASSKRTPV